MKQVELKEEEVLEDEAESATQPSVDLEQVYTKIEDLADDQQIADILEGESELFNVDDPLRMGMAWADLIGIPLTENDVELAKSISEIVKAVDPAQLSKDLIHTAITAGKSSNVVDDVASGLITAFSGAVRRGAIPKEAWDVVTKQAFGYALPYVTDNVDDFVMKTITGFRDYLVGVKDEGVQYPLSLLLSGLYHIMPPEGKTALLAGLSALVDAKAMMNPVTTTVDVASAILNGIMSLFGKELGALPIQAATNVELEGHTWSVFPIPNGYILIASEPVSGPDVLVYTAGVGKGPRSVASKITSALNNVLSSSVPMGDLVNAIVRAGIQPEVIQAVLQGATYDDTIRGVVRRALEQLIRYAAGKAFPAITSKLDELAKEPITAITDMAKWVKDFWRKMRSLPDTANQNDPTPEVQQVDVETQPSNVQFLHHPQVSQDLAHLGIDQVAQHTDDVRVDHWYPGRRPGTRGDKF